MAYRLLTGATGLLGRYLLRDLLLEGQPVAVLVRPSRLETAEERIDAVLAYWEEQWGRRLPRPVVLQGDVRHPLFGLERGDRDWLRRHADRLLHSAASLTFQEKDGEPWASNVNGVQNALDLCRECSLSLLEHVSTAYVCGLRDGRVLETELDVGQEHGNDYERSKTKAEQLIRSAGLLSAYTIFRPSIIVGDSRLGYTSSFHGFYSPLRVVAALLTSVDLHDALQVNYLELLGLSGRERKNFVPVDWVSEAITTILAREEPRNRTYALVSERPVSGDRLQRAFVAIVRKHLAEAGRSVAARRSGNGAPLQDDPMRPGLDLFRSRFVEQFAVYRSYWRDDPEFDCANTRAALPDLPCPELTDEVLQRLCRYALQTNFGFPQRRYQAPAFLPRQWLGALGNDVRDGLESTAQSTPRGDLGLAVTGPGGGCWTVRSPQEGSFAIRRGAEGEAPVARMTAETFHALISGRLSFDEARSRGALLLIGDPSASETLRAFLLAAVARSGT